MYQSNNSNLKHLHLHIYIYIYIYLLSQKLFPPDWLKFPLAHNRHRVDPSTSEKRPTPQSVHSASPSLLLNRPGSHTKHLSGPTSEDTSAKLNFPAGQSWQSSLPVSFAKLPEAHGYWKRNIYIIWCCIIWIL